jgi:hypothetical protein
MTTQAVALFLAASMAAVAAAQETKVPDDSQLVSINGCARNGNFVVGERREDQPGSLEIEPGRRFRLEGAKKLLNDIKLHQRTAMQVTGLIRKIDVNGPQGVSVMGGRVRIGGARVPQDAISNPARDPAYNQAVMDVRSWKALTGDCR